MFFLKKRLKNEKTTNVLSVVSDEFPIKYYDVNAYFLVFGHVILYELP